MGSPGKLATPVLQSLFSIGYNMAKLTSASWEEFKDALLALPIGALEAITLVKLQALAKLSWVNTKNKVARQAALTALEASSSCLTWTTPSQFLCCPGCAPWPGFPHLLHYFRQGLQVLPRASGPTWSPGPQTVIWESFRDPSDAPSGGSPSNGRRDRRPNGRNGGPSKPHYQFKCHPRPNGNAGSSNKKPRRPLSEVQCFKCEKFGHYTDQCPEGKEVCAAVAAVTSAPALASAAAPVTDAAVTQEQGCHGAQGCHRGTLEVGTSSQHMTTDFDFG